MAKVMIPIMILLSFGCSAQKVNDYTYKNVDTIFQYKNAEIIIYTDRNKKQKTDTIYYSKMKRDVSIEVVAVIFIYDTKLNHNP